MKQISAALGWALVSLTACSSNDTIAVATSDSGDAPADAASLDGSSQVDSTDAPACNVARWSARYGGSAPADSQAREAGDAIAADPTGNVFVTGAYLGDADFGGGARPSGKGNISMFLLKLDPAGKHVWSKGFGDPSQGVPYVPAIEGYAVAADAHGNVVVGGVMTGVVDLGGGALKTASTVLADGGQPLDGGLGDAGGCMGACSTDAFVAKYDASGGHQWSRTFGVEGLDSTRGVAFDAQGNVYAAGTFERSINLGGASLASAGQSDGWVVKLDPQGHHVWSVRFGGTGGDAAVGLAVDSMGNVVVAGVISDTVTLGVDSFTSQGMFDGVVLKLDAADGHVLWAKSAGASGLGSVQNLVVDKQDAIALTGIYQGSVDWGTGVITSAGGWDTFVAMLTPAGKTIWVKSFGSVGNELSGSIALGPSGRIVVVGQTKSPGGIDFGGGLIGGGPDGQAFVLQLDSTSGHVCSHTYGGPAWADGVAVDAVGNVITTGWFLGTLDVGLGPMVSTGGQDIYVSSLAP